MGRYVVTGCAGFIGSHLSSRLLDLGHTVTGVDAFTDYYPRRVKEINLSALRARREFSFLNADLATSDLQLDAVDGVFHLAGRPGVRSSWGSSFGLYVDENIVATQRVFEAAAARGVRVVFASSSSVYGSALSYPTPEDAPLCPESPYGSTKHMCEQLATAYRSAFYLDVAVLRYFTVYGPRQRPDMAFARILHALLRGTTFHVSGTGEQSRDFTFVQDAVSATIRAMEAAPGGAIYNIGGGAETTLHQVIEIVEHLAGRRLQLCYESAAAGDVLRTAADTARARAELDWRPSTSLEDGLAAQLEAMAVSRAESREAEEPARATSAEQIAGFAPLGG